MVIHYFSYEVKMPFFTNRMETLSKLFGSSHIVKILRLFVFNPNAIFEHQDIVHKTKVPEEIVRTEKAMLESIGLIKKRSFYKEVEQKKGKKTVVVKKRVLGWELDPMFLYLDALRDFLTETMTIDDTALLKKLRKGGTLKLVIASGFFTGDSGESVVDLLIVGDSVQEKKILPTIREIEAEMGREIRYSILSTKDFRYRLDLRDRLVHDILDYPHTVLVDKLDVV